MAYFMCMNLEQLKSLVQSHEQINAAYLFGTAATGKLRPNSDIDVALLLAEPYTHEELETIHTKVLSDIEAAFHREADVKILNTLEHLPLIQEIIARGIVLCDRNPEVRKAFVVKKNLEYIDFRPNYERMLNAYRERLRQRGRTESRAE